MRCKQLKTPLLHPHSPEKQHGFVLITGMLFLIVLTLLVLSQMRTGVLEEKMVGYSRDWNVAFQSAEMALREAEREILAGTRVSGLTGFKEGCSTTADLQGAGLCLPNPCTDTSATTGNCLPIWVDLAQKQHDTGWTSGASGGKSREYDFDPTLANNPPRYIIEALKGANSLGPKGGKQNLIYRVTAVGFGQSVNTRVVLQGSYLAP